MHFKMVRSNDDLDEKVYGIKVPKENLQTIYPDIVLVPLTAFHCVTLNRIGYGGGYYDQYIQ